MQTLAIKYRPKDFDSVVEQNSIKQILQDQIATGTHKNCYLFTGGAGTGKTTLARIVGKEINGGEGSLIEIDAASNNGVDNVREIIDNAKFKALDSKYKVYIIDECHMLSTGAWNAMLKLIEEPPAATIFIFCTTDPQKIPATILSRVQRYDFQRISHDKIVERLQTIMDYENEEACTGGCDGAFTYDLESLEYIAKLADGGMRDAITLLDKCISFNPDINIKNVIEALGSVNYEVMLNLTNSIIDRAAAEVIITIEEVHRQGLDLKQFIKQYSYFLLDISKYGLLGNFTYLQIPSTLESALSELTYEDHAVILFLLAKVLELSTNIKWETSPKPLIESTLLLLSTREEE